MKNIVHSFVIPAYKESPFIEECILSLKKQTVKNEIIITTSTPCLFLTKVSEKYGLPLIINNCCSGIASDWSFAYKSARTKYLTLAHQDDIYLPEYAETCLSAIKNNSFLILFTDYLELFGSEFVSLNLNMFIKKILLIFFLFKNNISSMLIKKLILSFGNPINCSAVTYNRELIGPFEFSKDFLVSVDWDTWLRLAQRKGRFIYVKKKLMIHRIHKNSEAVIQTKNQTRMKEDEMIFSRLWPKPITKILINFYNLSSKFTELRLSK